MSLCGFAKSIHSRFRSWKSRLFSARTMKECAARRRRDSCHSDSGGKRASRETGRFVCPRCRSTCGIHRARHFGSKKGAYPIDLTQLQTELTAANRRLDHTLDPEEEWYIRNVIRAIEALIELEKRSLEEEP